jgi:hypothetical protein
MPNFEVGRYENHPQFPTPLLEIQEVSDICAKSERHVVHRVFLSFVEKPVT